MSFLASLGRFTRDASIFNLLFGGADASSPKASSRSASVVKSASAAMAVRRLSTPSLLSPSRVACPLSVRSMPAGLEGMGAFQEEEKATALLQRIGEVSARSIQRPDTRKELRSFCNLVQQIVVTGMSHTNAPPLDQLYPHLTEQVPNMTMDNLVSAGRERLSLLVDQLQAQLGPYQGEVRRHDTELDRLLGRV